ncbi:MAG: thymidine phosphorylase [Oscillospiraceae bacterium]|nr:thymidine phosphorylase [Oscillospiraceae bacterium]
MQIYDLIQKTRRKESLSPEEIKFLVNGFTENQIPDYMMSAWLMAVCCQGLTDQETVSLTLAMRDSGECLDLSGIGEITVDKHSTGGIGDKTTLLIAPIVAACGGFVPKMSGRGLGFTGGTIDKLESIPGFSVEMPVPDFIRQVRKIGCAVISQSGNLTPADKKIYALRNLTATVDSIPLICSSIMSKKLALGADCILLDVKCGNGAFMKTPEEAVSLAEAMVRAGNLAGKKCRAMITDMNAPLGHAVGNALEVEEVIYILQGHEENALSDLALELSAHMLELSGKGDLQTCRRMASEAVASGKALEKLGAMIEAQGGDASVTEDTNKLPEAKCKKFFQAETSGYLSGIHSEKVGLACLELGAGKTASRQEIDHSAGIVFLHDIGDQIKQGEILAVIHGSSDSLCEQAESRLREAVRITEQKPEKTSLIYQTVSGIS